MTSIFYLTYGCMTIIFAAGGDILMALLCAILTGFFKTEWNRESRR